MEQPSTSQDVHQQALAAILAPIRDINENWNINLSKHLESYLRDLCSSDTNLQSINFVEAALVIQRSAGIYGKKVEYLWNFLLKVLESFQKKGGTEVKLSGKKKRACSTFELTDFVAIPLTINRRTWSCKVDSLKLDPPFYAELEYNSPLPKKLTLYDQRLEPLGDKTDFRLNSLFNNNFMLEEEMSYLEDEILSMVFESECLIHDTSSYECPVDNASDSKIADENDGDNGPISTEFDEEGELLRVRECQVGHQAENPEVLATVGDNALSMKAWDKTKNSIPEKPVAIQECYKLPCDIKAEKRRMSRDESKQEYMDISVLITSRFQDFTKKLDDCPKFRVEIVKEARNCKKKVKENKTTAEIEEFRKILARDFPGDFRGFEDYEYSSGEEDGFLGYPDGPDRDDNIFGDDAISNEQPAETENNLNDFPLPTTHPTAWEETYQNILQEKMQTARIGEQDAQAALATRVSQWHDSIRPKLKIAEERGSMDVHAYGTDILSAFPKGSGKYTISFRDVVAGKQQEEVCRYFLATLMLANTYNVEISKSISDELAMDCVELTLLKSVRHHETLDDYQAPSRASTSDTR